MYFEAKRKKNKRQRAKYFFIIYFYMSEAKSTTMDPNMLRNFYHVFSAQLPDNHLLKTALTLLNDIKTNRKDDNVERSLLPLCNVEETQDSYILYCDATGKVDIQVRKAAPAKIILSRSKEDPCCCNPEKASTFYHLRESASEKYAFHREINLPSSILDLRASRNQQGVLVIHATKMKDVEDEQNETVTVHYLD
jgi:HSP20 family molecular chaperone IbpA